MPNWNSTTDSTLTMENAATSMVSPVMMTASHRNSAAASTSGTMRDENSSAPQSIGGAASPLERNSVTGLMVWACCSGR